MSRRTPAIALLVALPVLLGGRGAGTAAVGVHDAPAERSDGSALPTDAAQQVADRVLARAAGSRAAGSGDDDRARRQVFSGPALREANAAARSHDRVDQSESVSDLEILGVSHGRDWPRAILATSRDGDTQYLHVLVSTAVDRPYTLFADVRMSPGARVPALAPVEDGAPMSLSDTPEGLASAVTSWAKGMPYPEPDEVPSGVSFDDSFSKALRKNAEAQAEDVEDVAGYTQRQAPADAPAITVDLAAGGELSFIPMDRTDTFTVEDPERRLTVGNRGVRRLLGASTVGRSLSVRHVETIATVTPESGEVTLVGASDVLQHASGR